MIQDYLIAKNALAAVEALASYNGRARIMAGGTDLVLDLQEGKHQADCIVDVSGIQELSQIKSEQGMIVIGAAVTHNQAAADPLILEHGKTLALASLSVGSHQIRNVSTIAGNIVSAQPAADTAVALTALQARVRVMDSDGTKEYSMEELYAGFGKSTIDSTKSLLTEIIFPMAAVGQGSAYARLQQRKALALPMLCVACSISVRDGIIESACIVMAPVGVGPVHAAAAELYLTGKKPEGDVLAHAGALALEDAAPRDSLIRGSRHYRMEVLPVLVVRALEDAIRDALRERGL